MTFNTERLDLKPTTVEDAVFIHELFNSPGWIKYIGDRKVYTIGDAQTYINTKIRPQFEKLGYGNYTIVRTSDGAKIGSCGLYERDGLPCIDIGFAFLPEYAKKGYAFEAAHKLKEMAFDIFHLEELSAITSIENKASQRLLSKLGLHQNGTIRLPGDTVELLFYHIKNT
ncbi:Protein N-acetyltransferase, RimJ/RimL family [Zobellia uliginosa]|uniref:Protein N-acetyltransferase, RimJ/RimL family n=1 Tax=Zobellia uliginosa TaxID=143224 RepID=A0ABY1L009_9FLAO|nr:GNAT family N-acetyltransferase [Zobellia uliginosa]SIS99279.1 Protein N-acetyltransferase, RimJ/RimL family [Zobellia uliginosa]